jgi:hypothetical protein
MKHVGTSFHNTAWGWGCLIGHLVSKFWKYLSHTHTADFE